MKVEPTAPDLLDAAREALLREVVPGLPEAARYAVLMAANAMAIAARELRAPDASQDELRRLAALLPNGSPAGDDAASLRAGTALLAQRIRAGDFSGGEARERLLAHLFATTRARLAVSNPRALERS